MNTAILKKVIEELKTEKPRLDYVLGMLETLFEMQDKLNLITPNIISTYVGDPIPPTHFTVSNVSTAPTTEAEILDARAKAAMESVKAMTKLE